MPSSADHCVAMRSSADKAASIIAWGALGPSSFHSGSPLGLSLRLSLRQPSREPAQSWTANSTFAKKVGIRSIVAL